MYPVVAIGNTEDPHIQRILSLHTPWHLALGRDYLIKKLSSRSALQMWNQGIEAYPSHLSIYIVIQAAPGK